MTNRERIMKMLESASNLEFARIFEWANDCDNCTYNGYCVEGQCNAGHAKWLEQEYKEPIKLTETESVILKNIDKKYQWIVRDGETNRLYIYVDKPRKYDNLFWQVGDYDMSVFNHLFKCIKGTDEEPYNIEELLEKNK